MTVAPTTACYALEIALGAVFLGWTGLRLFGACVDRTAAKPAPRWPDDQLPTYSVVAALYREAACVDDLLEAIESLDYPREKLDVILAVEADDDETIAAINARKTRLPITLIEVPPLGPRTKPKALNVALTFARGTFTVIFDAEDRPDATQLRRAVQAFSGAGDDLACVQAHLCIDNTRDSWLTHLFTAEYAGQFDVFLPGIAALHLPLPLGGSSNHFRTDTLRKVGGWDAYNMTEDADLGLRLARFGYRTGMIASTTYEEAPAEFGPWLRQRTRWYKGWMQTWLVHMRRPRRLFAELGFAGFTVFQLLVGGNVLAALVHPLFFAGWFYALISGYPTWAEDEMARMLAACYGGNLVVGYLTSAFLGWLGLRCRGLLSIAWMLIVMPLYWLILSLAAWRGLYQLMTAPYLWEKTEHGLARHSRRAESTTRSLHRLEHHLTRLQKSGELTRSADRPLVPDRLPQDIA
jgi:cellulose synthase/poly-beta-1,6-N-acetylglucosamine synthase-like glycosyltransferase